MAKLTKSKRGKAQINKIRDEKEAIKADMNEIQIISGLILKVYIPLN